MTTTICDKITRWSLYAAFLLVPIFFLPITVFPLALNKSVLLSVLVFVGFLSWLVQGIARGKFVFARGYHNYLVLALPIFAAFSAWFSGARHIGFWGATGGEVNTFVSLLAFGLLFFLTAAVFQKDGDRKTLISLTLISSAVVLAISVLQFLGAWIFPWPFAQRAVFNPIGTSNALAIYLGAAFTLAFSLLYLGGLYKKTVAKISLIVLAAALFIVSFAINFWVVFAGLTAAVAYLLLINAKPKISPLGSFNTKLLLAAAVLAVSLLVIFIRFNFFTIPLPTFNLPGEVVPSVSASWQITKDTLGEGLKNIVFGSGPATYQYKYAMHKSAAINGTLFWNTYFIQGFGAINTHLTEDGVLGTVLWLGFWLIVIIGGLKSAENFLSKKRGSDEGRVIFWAALLALTYLFITLFLYAQNFTNYFMLFALSGVLVGAVADRNNDYSTIVLAAAPRRLVIAPVVIALFLLVAAILYLRVQYYLGAISFERGVSVANDGGDIDKAFPRLISALRLNSRDELHLRAVADGYLLRIRNLFNSQQSSEKPMEQQEFQAKFADNLGAAVQAARRATEVNKLNGANWANLAGVYEAALTLVDGAADQSFQAYQKAAELEPTNPFIFGNLGRAYLAAGKPELAIEQLKKSVNLKANYAPARYWLAAVYQQIGDKNEALKQLEVVRQLSPDDPDVQRLADKLQNGEEAGSE